MAGHLDAALFPLWSFYAAPWLFGLATALAARVTGRPWHQALGIGTMAVPLWDTLWGILDSFGPLLQGGFVLQPYSLYQLSGLYTYKFLSDLGYLGVGFLAYASGGTWHGFWSLSPRRLAQRLVAAGLPVGRRGEARSALAGLLAFPLLLIGTYAFSILTSGLSALRQSDETSLFSNMTPYHAVVISLAAGFGEELAYRGLLMTALSRRMPMWGAVLAQAVFFGFAHSGYGTWIHVLEPALFGLVAGIAVWRFGLWAGITLHVLVDVYAFGAESVRHFPWVAPVLDTLLLANLLLSLAWAARWVWRALRFRQQVPPTA